MLVGMISPTYDGFGRSLTLAHTCTHLYILAHTCTHTYTHRHTDTRTLIYTYLHTITRRLVQLERKVAQQSVSMAKIAFARLVN